MKRRYKSPYIIAVLILMYVFPKALEYAYMERGYKTYGGEMLIPLFFIIIAYLVDEYMVYRRRRKSNYRVKSYCYYTRGKEHDVCQIQHETHSQNA